MNNKTELRNPLIFRVPATARKRVRYGMRVAPTSIFSVLLLSSQLHAQPMDFAQNGKALGELRQRLQEGCERLDAPPLDSAEFVLSDLHFLQARRFNEYSGDVSGRMVAALFAGSLALDKTNTVLNALLKEIPGLQKPDGHFGAEQDLARTVTQERDMPILWGNSRMLLALAQVWRMSPNPDPKLCETARKLGDYIIEGRRYFGKKENFENVGGALASGFTTCYPALIDGLVALGEVSGEQKYLQEAQYIAGLSLLDKEFAKHHSHGRLTAYRGILDLHRLMPVPDLIAQVVDGCRTIQAEYVLPIGGLQEVFSPTYDRDEGCSVADWVRVNALLWRATGEVAYLDAAQHAFENHLLAAQFRNGGFGHRQLRLLQVGGRTHLGAGLGNIGSESYWCCSMHGVQLLADLACYAFAKQGNTVYVTGLAEAEAAFRDENGTIRISAERLNAETWRIRTEATRPFLLKFRAPASSDQNPPKAAWSEKAVAAGAHSLRLKVKRHWKLVEARTGSPWTNGAGRIFLNSRLYVLPDEALPAGFLARDAVPRLAFAQSSRAAEELPVIVQGQDGQWLNASLVPASTRPFGGWRALFEIEPLAAGTFASPRKTAAPLMRNRAPRLELQFASSGSYRIYLNETEVLHGAGFQESPCVEVFGKVGQNSVAVWTQGAAPRPGVIGLVGVNGRYDGTKNAGWTARRCDQEPTPNTWKHEGGSPLLETIGAFGSQPWEYFPAAFAGSNARWIWPQDVETNSKWLFIRQIDLSLDSD